MRTRIDREAVVVGAELRRCASSCGARLVEVAEVPVRLRRRCASLICQIGVGDVADHLDLREVDRIDLGAE